MTDELYQFADTVGDGTGTTNANVDGTTPVVFKVVATGGKFYRINRLIFSITDTSASVVATNYGGLSQLGNGIAVGVYDTSDTVILDLCSGLPIKNNSDWGRMCFDIQWMDFGSDIGVYGRWTFGKDLRKALVLEPGQYLGIKVSDDLTGLLTHYFSIRGTKCDNC